MAGKTTIELELQHERQELAEAVHVLREDVEDAAEKAKKASLALGAAVAVLVTAKKLLQLRKRS